MLKSRSHFNHRFHKWCYCIKNITKLLDAVHRMSIDLDDMKKDNRALRVQLKMMHKRVQKLERTEDN